MVTFLIYGVLQVDKIELEKPFKYAEELENLSKRQTEIDQEIYKINKKKIAKINRYCKV